MKCKACNVVLLDDELKMLGEEMELCSDCLDSIDSRYEDCFEATQLGLLFILEGFNEDSDY